MPAVGSVEAQLELEAVELRRMVVALARSESEADQRQLERRAAAYRGRLADHLMQRMVHRRPEVISQGKPQAVAAQRGQEEAKRRLRVNADAQALVSRCPAAQTSRTVTGHVCVVCKVTDSLMTSQTDPQSLLTFCFGNADACPAWRVERELTWARKTPPSEEAA